MTQNKVTVEIRTYDDPPTEKVKMHSHAIFDDRIVLEWGTGKVTVVASDLQSAIKAATAHTGF